MNQLHYREDLRRAGLEALKHRPQHAGYLSVNEMSGTVSDRRTGEVVAYVAPAFTTMTAAEYIGRHEWPARISV